MVSIEVLPEVRLNAPARPVHYAESLQKMGEMEAAEKILGARLQRPIEHQETTELTKVLGILLQHQGRYDEAYKCFAGLYKKLRYRDIEKQLNPQEKFDLAINLIKALFQMQHTKNYLQLGSLKDHIADLRALQIRADVLGRDFGVEFETSHNLLEDQKLNLKRHLLQCIALHDPSDVFAKEFEQLETEYQQRDMFTERLFSRMVRANWERATGDLAASRATALHVHRLAVNIGHMRLRENALRCLGEVEWMLLTNNQSGSPDVDRLRNIWHQWHDTLSTTSSPYIGFHTKLCQARYTLWRHIAGEPDAPLALVLEKAQDLDEVVTQRYSTTSDLLLRPLTMLFKHSVQSWNSGEVDLERFSRIAEPFIVWGKHNGFWCIRELANELTDIGTTFSIEQWQRSLLLRNFQLWG